MNIKNYLWMIPFLAFVLGYSAMQWLFHTKEVITPHLVGNYIHEILPIVSQNNLNIRLMDQKEEADIPEGIILNQSPIAGRPIKPNQPLFIVTTKKPLVKRAPHCVGLSITQLLSDVESLGIDPRVYHIAHPYPEEICFAQSPQPNEPLEKNRLIVYISSGNNKPIIWPNLVGISLANVTDFLDNHGIKPYIINDNINQYLSANEYTIVDQRPLAGTLLTIDDKKPLSVQLRIH